MVNLEIGIQKLFHRRELAVPCKITFMIHLGPIHGCDIFLVVASLPYRLQKLRPRKNICDKA